MIDGEGIARADLLFERVNVLFGEVDWQGAEPCPCCGHRPSPTETPQYKAWAEQLTALDGAAMEIVLAGGITTGAAVVRWRLGSATFPNKVEYERARRSRVEMAR